MKAIIYYIFLFVLLASGSNHLYANTHKSSTSSSFSKNDAKSQQFKHKNSNNHNTINVVIEVNFEEDFHSNENHKEGDSNNLFGDKNACTKKWYSAFSTQFLHKSHSFNTNIVTPLIVYSIPIYLTIRDLRI